MIGLLVQFSDLLDSSIFPSLCLFAQFIEDLSSSPFIESAISVTLFSFAKNDLLCSTYSFFHVTTHSYFADVNILSFFLRSIIHLSVLSIALFVTPSCLYSFVCFFKSLKFYVRDFPHMSGDT